MNNQAREWGFTLIEMLIAIALTAVIAAMSYQSLDSASRSATRTREVLMGINKLDKAWQVIAQDLRNVVPPVMPMGNIPQKGGGQTQTPNGKPPGPAAPGTIPPLAPAAPQAQVLVKPPIGFRGESLKSKGKNSLQVIMQFLRRGWFNPMERLRSDMQIVQYRVSEGKLIRDYVPDRNVIENLDDFERESLHQVVIDGVTDIQLRFLSRGKIANNGKGILEGTDYSNTWETTWPSIDGGGAMEMPIAVEVTIEVENVGRSVRLFELPQSTVL